MNKQFSTSWARSTLVAVLSIACMINANAGRHYFEKDEFDGTSFSVYVATEAEKAKAGFDFMLTSYDPSDETMTLVLLTPFGNACDSENIELKTSDGIIHSLKALVTKDGKSCVVAVYVSWIKKNFSVRIPMVVQGSLVGKFDTETLKPERYRKVK